MLYSGIYFSHLQSLGIYIYPLLNIINKISFCITCIVHSTCILSRVLQQSSFSMVGIDKIPCLIKYINIIGAYWVILEILYMLYTIRKPRISSFQNAQNFCRRIAFLPIFHACVTKKRPKMKKSNNGIHTFFRNTVKNQYANFQVIPTIFQGGVAILVEIIF